MSDWQVGDLAVCVDNTVRRREKNAARLDLYRAYRVAKVGVPVDAAILCLSLDEIGGVNENGKRLAFDARRFRKILPDKREACESEFITLLKRRTAPVSQAEHIASGDGDD